MSLAGIIRRRVAPFVAAQIPAPLAWRAAGQPVVIPYYHVVGDEPVAHVKYLYRFRASAEFERDIDYFLRVYTPVTLQQLIDHVQSGAPLPERALHLTFDDGFREMHDVVMPILVRKGMPATFFLISGFLDNHDMAHHNRISVLLQHLESAGPETIARAQKFLRENGVPGEDVKTQLLSTLYPQREIVKQTAALAECDLDAYLAAKAPFLSASQVEAMLRAGFSVGAHSVDHPRYSEIAPREQLEQTRESVKFISKRFKIACHSFAFPLTANGVGRDFFQTMLGGGELKISFGTAGMRRHFCPRHLERFTMEKTDRPAEQILARQYLKTILRR